jgi:thiamine pyrophosphokinase
MGETDETGVLSGLSGKKENSWLRAQLRELGIIGSDLRVGVDGGARFWLSVDLAPQIAVGDWDSLGEDPSSNPDYQETQILTLPRRKDASDLHYTLEVLKDLGVREVVCLGFTGGRPDHHLANLMEMAEFAGGTLADGSSMKITAIGNDAEYYWVIPARPLELSPRVLTARQIKTLSVFAWGHPADGVSLDGLEYSLKEAGKVGAKAGRPGAKAGRPGVKAGRLEPSSRGLSNTVVSSRVKIAVRKGLLLVVIPR